MNIYQMIKKKSNCFTMTIFLMFKIKLVRLKCPLAYAWVKNNVPSNFQLSFLDIDEVIVHPGVVFFNRNDTISKISFHGEKGNL